MQFVLVLPLAVQDPLPDVLRAVGSVAGQLRGDAALAPRQAGAHAVAGLAGSLGQSARTPAVKKKKTP